MGKYLIAVHSDGGKRLRLLWQCNNRARKPAGSPGVYIIYYAGLYISSVLLYMRTTRPPLISARTRAGTRKSGGTPVAIRRAWGRINTHVLAMRALRQLSHRCRG
jgi:hypothetical protein